MTSISEHPTVLAKARERDAWKNQVGAIMAIQEKLMNAVDAARIKPVLKQG